MVIISVQRIFKTSKTKTMSKYYYFLLGFLFLFTTNLHAQMRCNAQQLHENKLYNDPEYAKGWEQFQRQRTEWMNQAQARTDNTSCQGNFKTIPVVVHYEYNPQSEAERTCLINLANSQITHMNQAFSGQLCQDAAPTTSSSGGCLQFVIANQNHPASANLADGQPAILFGSGICPNGLDGNGELSYIPCAVPEWKGYLNIVVKIPLGMLAGVANLPPTSSIDLIDGPANSTNTIILGSCDFGVAGTPCGDNFVGGNNCQGLTTTGGRTVTHEFGHFLGLLHTFCADRLGNPSNSMTDGSLPANIGGACETQAICGGGCVTNACDCDGFMDTPPQAYSEYTAPCDAPNGVLPNPSTGTNYNYNNFMDYIADKCMTCFSSMQANQIFNRARSAANNVKPNVIMGGNAQTCPNGQALQAQGTNCDDGNANTMNDVIQADGCTCAGTPVQNNQCPDGTAQADPGTPCTLTDGNGQVLNGQIGPNRCDCIVMMNNQCPDGTAQADPGTPCSLTDGNGQVFNGQIGPNRCDCIVMTNNQCPDGTAQADPGTPCTLTDGNGQVFNGQIGPDRCNCIVDGNAPPIGGDGNGVGGDSGGGGPAGGGSGSGGGGANISCDNILLSATDDQINVANLAPVSIIKVYLVKPNGGWELREGCNGDCGESVTFGGLPAGNYIIVIDFFNANYNGKICATQLGMIVGSGQENCPDGTLKSNPDTACNDGDANTMNDRIQADGCTCRGEPVIGGSTGCDNITITTANGRIRVNNLAAPVAQVKLYRIKSGGGWELVDRCNGDCGAEKTFSNLADGHYIVDVALYTANYTQKICGLNQTIALGATFNNPAQSRSIQLLEFAAYKNKRAVELQWITNTGYKNQKYVLEKSTNGKDFQALMTIENTTTSTVLQSFKETDSQPTVGSNFYRLKQIYQDGSFEYSPAQMVQFDGPFDVLAVFPNPVKELLNIDLAQYVDNSVTIKIVDVLGKEYAEQHFEKPSENVLQMSTQALTNGLYYVVIKIGNRPAFTKKIIVNHWY